MNKSYTILDCFVCMLAGYYVTPDNSVLYGIAIFLWFQVSERIDSFIGERSK
jgi:hypothetical protein